MSLADTYATPPSGFSPDDIMAMFDNQAQLYTDPMWLDTNSTLDYEDMALFDHEFLEAGLDLPASSAQPQLHVPQFQQPVQNRPSWRQAAFANSSGYSTGSENQLPPASISDLQPPSGFQVQTSFPPPPHPQQAYTHQNEGPFPSSSSHRFENQGSSSHTIRHSPYANQFASVTSFGSYMSAASSRSSVATPVSINTRPAPYPQSRQRHSRQSSNTAPSPPLNQDRNRNRNRRGTEINLGANNNRPFGINEFYERFPRYSTILPAIYSTATSLAFALDDNHDWLADTAEGKPSPLLGYARLAVEIIVKCHLEDPKDVDISHEVPAVGNYLRYVNQWCIDSILEFRDSCRREGRVWAADGYGFSATKDKAYNIKQHKAVITHARYLHYFSGKKASLARPIPFANPVILKTYQERFYLAVDSLAKRMHVVIQRYQMFASMCPVDLSWKVGNLKSFVLAIVSGRHGAHEWHRGCRHATRWNSSDVRRFPRYMSLIQKNQLGRAKGIYGPIASGWYRSINFRPPPPADDDISGESNSGYISPETDDNMGL